MDILPADVGDGEDGGQRGGLNGLVARQTEEAEEGTVPEQRLVLVTHKRQNHGCVDITKGPLHLPVQSGARGLHARPRTA